MSGPEADVVQRVSLSAELTEEIDTADLSSPHMGGIPPVIPPAWRGAAAPDSTEMETGIVVAEAAPVGPQLAPANEFSQPFATFSGPSFGTPVVETTADEADATGLIDDIDSLTTEADTDGGSRVAGKPMTFWAMIGGLILLLACAFLRRPSETQETFH
jgi:hypothetical protein